MVFTSVLLSLRMSAARVYFLFQFCSLSKVYMQGNLQKNYIYIIIKKKIRFFETAKVDDLLKSDWHGILTLEHQKQFSYKYLLIFKLFIKQFTLKKKVENSKSPPFFVYHMCTIDVYTIVTSVLSINLANLLFSNAPKLIYHVNHTLVGVASSGLTNKYYHLKKLQRPKTFRPRPNRF